MGLEHRPQPHDRLEPAQREDVVRLGLTHQLPYPHATLIVPRTTRSRILQKLEKKRKERLPIFIASAGSGLVAQLLEKAGVDCVNTFSGARLRANGMGTMSM